MSKKFILILFLVTLSLNLTYAYTTCDGGYSPYPVKCIGGSLYQNENVQTEELSLSTVIILILLIIIIYLLYNKKKRR